MTALTVARGGTGLTKRTTPSVAAVTDAALGFGEDRRRRGRAACGHAAATDAGDDHCASRCTPSSLAALTASVAVAALPAAAQTYYTINGRLASYDIQLYMAQNGLPAGHYWLDARGYWGVMGDPNPWGQHLQRQLRVARRQR